MSRGDVGTASASARPAAAFAPGATSFWADYGEAITAALSIALALGLAIAVDRALSRRGRRLAQAVVRGELSPVADTRLRFVRRLVEAVIVVVGIAVALSQFTGLSRLAASLLASSALAAAVLGFAARQTLANVVAGVMLAIAQPFRVGDWIRFEDFEGEVEDVRLNYTLLRTPTHQRVMIPNERLAAGVLRNDSLVTPDVAVQVSVWVPASTDADRALAVLSEDGSSAAIAEVTADAVRLDVGAERVAARERVAAEARLRADALRRLRAAGLGSEP